MGNRILVVDDERASRRSLAMILEIQGYRVETAATGEEALEKISKKERKTEDEADEFDLALLDLKLPGMDGLEVMQALRQRYPDIQIILLTGHGSLQSAIQALQAGANDYLLKPCAPPKILESVSKGIAQREKLRQQTRLLLELERSTQSMRVLLGGESEGQQESEDIQEAEGARSRHLQVDTRPLGTHVILLGADIFFDVLRREVRQGRQRINLTRAESRLLRVLAEQPGQAVSHQQLANAVQGYAVAAWEAPGILRPLISRLRSKLSEIEGGDGWIVSVRSGGYLLEVTAHSE